jgi:hypothetical protein
MSHESETGIRWWEVGIVVLAGVSFAALMFVVFIEPVIWPK